LKHGADTNIIYPEDSLKDMQDGLIIPALSSRKKNKNRDSGTSYASNATAGEDLKPASTYSCTVLINYI